MGLIGNGFPSFCFVYLGMADFKTIPLSDFCGSEDEANNFLIDLWLMLNKPAPPSDPANACSTGKTATITLTKENHLHTDIDLG